MCISIFPNFDKIPTRLNLFINLYEKIYVYRIVRPPTLNSQIVIFKQSFLNFVGDDYIAIISLMFDCDFLVRGRWHNFEGEGLVKG